MINGDLHLDGYMIGRFISEYLAEAATRPLAGATGFDPRISPAWSGPAGAAMLEAAKGFRRLKAHKQLPVLRTALADLQKRHASNKMLAPHAVAA